jgi:hypothetical protein
VRAERPQRRGGHHDVAHPIRQIHTQSHAALLRCQNPPKWPATIPVKGIPNNRSYRPRTRLLAEGWTATTPGTDKCE